MIFLVNGYHMFPCHRKAAGGRARGRKFLPTEVATEIFRLISKVRIITIPPFWEVIAKLRRCLLN